MGEFERWEYLRVRRTEAGRVEWSALHRDVIAGVGDGPLDVDAMLLVAGHDGWELVAVTALAGPAAVTDFFFKRRPEPLPSRPPAARVSKLGEKGGKRA